MSPFRILLAVAFLWLAFLCLHEAQRQQRLPEPDPNRVVMMFGGMIVSGLVAAGLLVTTVLPKLGESVGNFFFNPDVKSEDHPHQRALAAMARGDYARAVEEYRAVAEKNPEDTLALSEAARLLCDKLHECQAAAELLETALGRDWHAEDAAFLSLRLVDVYWHHQQDPMKARELLLQVMEALPDSKHATAAAHKLHELDRQLMMQG